MIKMQFIGTIELAAIETWVKCKNLLRTLIEQ